MSIERIGMEKALPMFVLGIGCLFATSIIFGILCGKMIRRRRLIQQENKEQILSNNTNQNSSRIAVGLDPTFKIHPYHKFPNKRIVEL